MVKIKMQLTPRNETLDDDKQGTQITITELGIDGTHVSIFQMIELFRRTLVGLGFPPNLVYEILAPNENMFLEDEGEDEEPSKDGALN